MNNEYNEVVLANEIDSIFLSKFSEYPIIEGNLKFDELKSKLEFHPAKKIVLDDTFYNLREKEIEEILDILKKQNMYFILITSNVEYTLYGEYIKVYDGKNIVLEGTKEVILKEEKKLKKWGYGLPFVVDLSTQLNYYDIFDKVFYDMDELVGALWN